MNTHSVMSYLTSRQWAMDPQHLRATADAIAVGLEKIPAATLDAAAKRAPQADAGPGYIVRDGVAHIKVSGPILKEVPCVFGLLGMQATSTLAVQAAIEAAINDDAVNSISLDIDSPGGTLAGTQELADTVAAANSLKPVVANISDLAASAAYWIASQAAKVTANEGALVGSIGVYSVMEDTSGAAAQAGVKVHVLRSHALKGAGVEGDQITAAQLADSQRIVDEAASMFIAAVARGRGLDANSVRELATGQVWFASAALERRLIDGLASSQDAHNAIKQPSGGITASSATTAPSVGAQEKDMSDPKISTTGAQADAERIAQLEAGKAKAEAEAAAMRATIEALNSQQREQLIEKYRDRVAPAALESVRKVGATQGADLAGFESFLKALPVITRADRITSAVDQAAAAVGVASAAETIEERSLAKVFGQSVDRLRDMQAIGEAVDHVEHEKVVDASGGVTMVPKAVLKDGSRVTRTELRSKLGLKGALACVAFALASLFSGTAHAGALSAARATECKSTATSSTQAFLMKASTTIYAGSLVMVDSNGVALPAAASASNHGVVGVAQVTKTSAASGSYWIPVTTEAICKFAATSIAQTAVGSIMFATNDQTVDETQGANEPVAGILVGYVSATVGWLYVSPSIQARYYYSATDPLTLTGDLTLEGGAGALTFGAANSSVVLPDNSATGLIVGSTGHLNTLTVDTSDAAEGITVTGYETVTGVLTSSAGAGALTFTSTNASIVLNDNDASALDIGSTGATSLMRFSTLDAGGSVAVTGNLSTTGTLTSSITSSIGWSVVAGANTACNTTCTSGCVFGQNTADMTIVDCAAATADVCVCAGAN